MKKLSVFVAALALTFGLAQCKKEQTPTSNASDGVFITLNVGGGNGSRVDVDPTGHTDPDYATVDFEDGDIIYVGNNGAYCGYLEYDGTTNKFSGSIGDSNLSESDYLHFYFMGNKGGKSQPSSVNISDQTSEYPVISYAPSKELYSTGTTSYTARLLNKCAIVKFNITGVDTDKDITITGMNNTVTVNFAANNAASSTTGEPYSFSKSDEGEITLHAKSNTERWAILLPQAEVTTATASAEGYATQSAFTVPAIAANDYETAGIEVALVATAPAAPQGAISGLFSVSETKQVYFSKGNLQYIGSAGNGDDNNTGAYWKFAENQWDYLGDNGQGSTSQTADRDLFGWGTSGYNHGATAYQPWSTSTGGSQYQAYGKLEYNLYDSIGNADWGYNPISNGGNLEHSGWRTLTKEEWDYVFNTRTTSSGIRYAKAQVAGVKGLILLPDDWSSSTYILNSTNSASASFTSNTITTADWTNTLEDHGAVFLPAAGYRNGLSFSDVGSYGWYWSSSYYSNTYFKYYAYKVYFSSAQLTNVSYSRTYGFSVRLVRDVQ